MELRLRKGAQGDGNSIDIAKYENRISELEILVASFRQMLEISRNREKKLVDALAKCGGNIDLENGSSSKTIVVQDNSSQDDSGSLLDRGGWLVGLLIIQSCSSFILSANNHLFTKHPTIIFFLTMMIGAGGNAGNQASVRAIRGIALGTLAGHSIRTFIIKETIMACYLSAVLGFIGFLRAVLSFDTTFSEAVAITIALMCIVFISVIIGAVLPILLNLIGIDPAHASTSIQVIMDISGVLIICCVATVVLDILTA